jgi:hypothetical protein
LNGQVDFDMTFAALFDVPAQWTRKCPRARVADYLQRSTGRHGPKGKFDASLSERSHSIRRPPHVKRSSTQAGGNAGGVAVALRLPSV